MNDAVVERGDEQAAYMAVTKSLNGISFSPDMPRLQQDEHQHMSACVHF
jgi:hypothetical protein